ncbi:hypothetical protein PAT3040_06413 [Paenibacillus agaridevorans]|uniref:Fibronectin type-III domain-containing protein n=1 Tax=Paenibacillus agaridevorans TaxID=171404 RepID=A0A2R5F5K5_9BACL|nr:hypothetical protein PAT3040_06413 [Paenibacillus agaridevorans]
MVVHHLKLVLVCLICGLGIIAVPNAGNAAAQGVEDADNQAALFSLRQLVSDYNGPLIQVRRSDDHATMDVYSDAEGELELEALLEFVGSANGHVAVWYDQSGNAANAVQAIPARQPLIVSEGVPQMLDGRPAIYFDEFNELALSDINVPAPLSINVVGRTTFGNGSRYLFDPNGAELYRWNVAPAANEMRVGNAGHLLQAPGLDFRESFVSTAIINGSSSSLSLNGTVVAGTMGSKGLTSTATLGSNTVGVGLVGYLQEALIFGDALSSVERSAIEADQTERYLAPNKVRKLKATVSGNQVTLKWSAPLSSYEPVTGYRVEYKQASSSAWLLHSTTASRSAVISGLTVDAWYDFRIRAVNSYGAGLESDVLSRKLGNAWGKIADDSAASNVLASTLYFPGKPNDNYMTAYTALPLETEMNFQEEDIRIQLRRMKEIGINAVQISFFGADTLSGSKFLPMNAWRNRTDGQIFEDYDRLIALIEEEGLYFYPLIETSSTMSFYLDFGVANQKLVDRIGYWAERWGDSPSWLKLYNVNGEAKKVVSFIESVKMEPYASSLFDNNLTDIAEAVASDYDMEIGFALDPTRLPKETEGGILPGAYGPKPADLAGNAHVLLIHPWELTVDGSTEEQRTRWATRFLKTWKDAGYPVASFMIAGYDSTNVFPSSDVYGKTAQWRALQQTLAVTELGSAGVTFGPWNGWTEWFHITKSRGSGGDANLAWARESIRINQQRASAKPGYVENLAISAASSSLTLTWQAPISNGGSAVTDYAIAFRANGSGTWTLWPESVSAVTGAYITGLAANTLYEVEVRAINGNGGSEGATRISLRTL